MDKGNQNVTIRIAKHCPVCSWRIFDKVTPTSGIIEIKCPRCGQVVKINLALRQPIHYRLLYQYTGG